MIEDFKMRDERVKYQLLYYIILILTLSFNSRLFSRTLPLPILLMGNETKELPSILVPCASILVLLSCSPNKYTSPFLLTSTNKVGKDKMGSSPTNLPLYPFYCSLTSEAD